MNVYDFFQGLCQIVPLPLQLAMKARNDYLQSKAENAVANCAISIRYCKEKIFLVLPKSEFETGVVDAKSAFLGFITFEKGNWSLNMS